MMIYLCPDCGEELCEVQPKGYGYWFTYTIPDHKVDQVFFKCPACTCMGTEPTILSTEKERKEYEEWKEKIKNITG